MQGVNDRDETSGSVTIGVESNTQQFDEQKEKFKKEARRLWKLKNEHIVKVHDLFEENGTAYYVMDYIEGESLAERIKKTGNPFTEAEVRGILSQILEALKEVHQNEIWHLDLKPGNIMVDKLQISAIRQVMHLTNKLGRCMIVLDHGQTSMPLVLPSITF